MLGTVFSFAGGVASFGFGKPLLDRAKASTEWSSTDGEVIESEVETSGNNDGDTMYKAMVIYKSSLDGENLESDRIWYGGGYSANDWSAIQAVVRDYPAGKQVSVYYSPDNPNEPERTRTNPNEPERTRTNPNEPERSRTKPFCSQALSSAVTCCLASG